MSRKSTYMSFVFLGGTLIGIDRLTKWWALDCLLTKSIHPSSFLSFSFVLNKGISWSLLSSHSTFETALLTCIITLFLGIFFMYTYFEYQKGENIIPELCILAGGLSNLIDRIALGGVVDFIDFHLGDWHFATFNVADVCITVGALGIILRVWYEWFQGSGSVR